MPEQTRSSTEAMLDMGWDSAIEANRSHTEYIQRTGAHAQLTDISALEIPGVDLRDATEITSVAATDALASHERFVKMAAVVISDEANPFGPQSTEADSSLDEIDRAAIDKDKARESIFDQLLSSHDVY